MGQTASLAQRGQLSRLESARSAAGRLIASWITAEHRRFALWLPVALGGGVLAYFDLDREPPWWLGLAIAGGGLALVLGMRRRPMLWAVAMLPLAFGLGFAAATLATLTAMPIAGLPRYAVVLTGRVRLVEPLPNGSRVTIAEPGLDGAKPIARSVRIRLRRGDPVALAAGDQMRVRALIEPPAAPSYPGAWDLQRDAFFSGMAGYGFALGPAAVLSPAAHGGIAERWEALREAIAARIRAVLPGPTGAIAATLLTGTSTAIPEPDRAAFRDSGLAHLLSVAGLHIGIVMGLVFMLCRALLALSERASLHWPAKAIAAMAALGAGGLYMLLTGMHLPIMRSFVMAVLAVLGLALGRRVISLRGLALAAVVLLLIEPAAATGVSFQMSFAAVLVLISGYEALRPWLSRLYGSGRWWRRALLHLLLLALTSLLAGTASLPFAAYHFGHIQLYYVLANLAAVPITAVWVMPAGLAALAFMPLGLERVALVPMGWGVDVLLAIARGVAGLPAARLAVPHMPAWGLGIVALGLAWLCLWRSRLRLAGILMLVVGLASPLLAPAPDIFVSSTAGLIGFHTPDGVFVEKTGRGADRFTRDAWQNLWLSGAFRPLPKQGTLAGGILRCTPADCLYQPRKGGPSALLLRGADAPDRCPTAAVVLAASPDRGRCSDGGVPVVDRFSVWRNGAYALWLGRGGARIVSDRSLSGDRPWVPAPPGDAGAASLPMAKTIKLPAE